MGRPLYPYELGDPDFSWLISHFLETRPEFVLMEASCLPVVFLPVGGGAGEPALPPAHALDPGAGVPDEGGVEEKQ